MEGQSTQGRIDADFVSGLVQICGPANVVSDPTTLNVYRGDAGSRAYPPPAVVVLPASAEEVAAVVAACFAAHVPWVARGAGTGLSGGAAARPDAVLVVLSRMRQVLSVDLENALITVEPGVTNAAISRAVGPSHFYPPDPASRRVCTLGGDVAQNAGGPHSLKYGATADFVTGLDVVLPDGSRVWLERDAAGLDLLGPVVGSEGTLGVAVAVQLRVLPVPQSSRTAIACFESLADAARAVSAILAADLAPAAMELLDARAMRAVEEAARAGYRSDAAASLLIEFDGLLENCVSGLEAALGLCARAGACDVRIALDAEEREALWSTHRDVFSAMRRVSGGYAIGDAAIPRTRLGAVLERISALSAEFGLAVAHVIGAGDGRLNPIVCFDASDEAQVARAAELAERILGLCQAAGGSIAASHGIGVGKVTQLESMFQPDDLAAFDRLRRAFDPRGLANPGKLTGAGSLAPASGHPVGG